VLPVHAGDVLGDLEIALEDPEVGVGDEDRGDAAPGEPLELRLTRSRSKQWIFCCVGLAPVAERAAIRAAAAVGLERREGGHASGQPSKLPSR
jgi:hypothetical protein